MIFSELYGAYYNTTAHILKAALDHPLDLDEMRRIIHKYAFAESILNIESAFTEGRWKLLSEDGAALVDHVPTLPLTNLQKRWLKAISTDPRIQLFEDIIPDFLDVEPLFTQEDYFVFDKYLDGDPYEDDAYKRHFRLILDAVRNRYPLRIDMRNHRDRITRIELMPEYLEYSEKDDKIRLIGSGRRCRRTVNLGRIIACKRAANGTAVYGNGQCSQIKTVEFELVDERNALERVLLHFAHFEKQAEKTDGNRYRVSVKYDKNDETEVVIRLLSFGPMVKVTAPLYFVNLIKKRLIRQKDCVH